MPMAPRAQQIIHGTWDDIAARAAELRGRQLTLIVAEERPEGAAAATPLFPTPDAENAAAIAYLQERLKGAPADPEAVRRAEDELEELHRNLDRNRIEAGERPLFSE